MQYCHELTLHHVSTGSHVAPPRLAATDWQYYVALAAPGSARPESPVLECVIRVCCTQWGRSVLSSTPLPACTQLLSQSWLWPLSRSQWHSYCYWRLTNCYCVTIPSYECQDQMFTTRADASTRGLDWDLKSYKKLVITAFIRSRHIPSALSISSHYLLGALWKYQVELKLKQRIMFQADYQKCSVSEAFNDFQMIRLMCSPRVLSSPLSKDSHRHQTI